jgi:hypothetical protein
MKRILLISLCLIVSGCAFAPYSKQELSQMSSFQLCQSSYFSARDTLMKKRWVSVVEEINLRKIDCSSIHADLMRQEAINNAAAANLFLGVMGAAAAAQPTYVAPQAPSNPSQCRVIKGTYGDRIYCN